MSKKPRLAISLGDPAGIGPEVVLAALARADVSERYACTVVGDRRLIEGAAERLGLPVPAQVHSPEGVECPPELLFAGTPSVEGGRASAGAVRAALGLVLAGEADALVTAPLNKEALGLAGEPYPGHTELLAAELKAPRVRMMLQGGGLRVVLATTHLALRDVADALTSEGIADTCRVAAESLRRFGVSDSPRLAVVALNPHASDGGRFGDEEQRIVSPGIELARSDGLTVSGPHPADTFFARVARQLRDGDAKAPDAVIALYHDQGLIPVKLIAFGAATNVTLGLPVVRTSPDHGTAYDIAGRGVAEADSFLEALSVAASLAKTARS